jgi:hypothetical protein
VAPHFYSPRVVAFHWERYRPPSRWRESRDLLAFIAVWAVPHPPDGAALSPPAFGDYLTVIAKPLRSALTMAPTESPVRFSTAPFWLVRTIACTPWMTAAPTLPAA